MKDRIETTRRNALEEIASARSGTDLEAVKVKYLGKKGELTSLLKMMGGLSAEERPVVGKIANEARLSIESALSLREDEIGAAEVHKRLI